MKATQAICWSVPTSISPFKLRSEEAVRKGLWVAEGVGFSGKSTLHPEIVAIKGWWWYRAKLQLHSGLWKIQYNTLYKLCSTENYISTQCAVVWYDCTFDAATPQMTQLLFRGCKVIHCSPLCALCTVHYALLLLRGCKVIHCSPLCALPQASHSCISTKFNLVLCSVTLCCFHSSLHWHYNTECSVQCNAVGSEVHLGWLGGMKQRTPAPQWMGGEKTQLGK